MKEFFHGWRRKAGCVSLVMALAVMGMWGRASILSDQIDVQMDNRRHMIASMRDGVVWLAMDGELKKPWYWESHAADLPVAGILDLWMSIGQSSDRRPQGWVVYYWTLALPLTLISAYLLLWPQWKSCPN